MRKIQVVCLFIACSMTLTYVGCGSSDSSQETSSPASSGSSETFSIEGAVSLLTNLIFPMAYAQDVGLSECQSSCSNENACAKLYYYTAEGARNYACKGDFDGTNYSITFSSFPDELHNAVTEIVVDGAEYDITARMRSTILSLEEGGVATRNIDQNGTIAAPDLSQRLISARQSDTEWDQKALDEIQTIESAEKVSDSTAALNAVNELGVLDDANQGSSFGGFSSFVNYLKIILENPSAYESFRRLYNQAMAFSLSNGGFNAISSFAYKATFSATLSVSDLASMAVQLNETEQSTNEDTLIKQLMGSYQSSCLNMGSFYLRKIIDFKYSSGSILLKTYNDEECDDLTTTIEKYFAYQIQDASAEPPLAINLTYRSSYVHFAAESSASYNNTNDLCGFSDWVVGIKRDVSGLNCSGYGLPAIGEVEYDVFQLDTERSPFTLKMGNQYHLSHDFSRVGDRPVAVADLTLTKVE